MTVNAEALVADLQRQLRELESDLWTRLREPGGEAALRARWELARHASPTVAPFESWLEERVTLGAASWLLGTVLLRFCEDNELIDAPYLAGRGERLALARDRQTRFLFSRDQASDRDWLLEGLRELKALQASSGLLDPDGAVIQLLEISEAAASSLIDFWRRSENGRLVYDFHDPARRTDFLADVYQGLSESQRAKYSLVKTPDFLVDLLVEMTLRPAIEEFGPDRIRCLDPVCGSGTFLLTIFHRLNESLTRGSPSSQGTERVKDILRAVHGVDRNPIAVAISRFRLLLAASAVCNVDRLVDLPQLRIIVATGDSLLQDGVHDAESDVDKFSDVDLLAAKSYHVVVGNPPYVTPRLKAEADTYRSAYPYASGFYSLVVPFIVRFFQLGVEHGNGEAGHIGLLVSNSFMKREYGRRLVEEFLSTIDVTHMIDTSGVFIPGHGTPTLILIGQSKPAGDGSVRIVAGLKGEPSIPEDPANGVVFQSIRRGLASAPYKDDWIQVTDVDRGTLRVWPLNLSGESSTDILRLMERGGEPGRLGARISRIGYFASTGSDDVFIAPSATFRRIDAERELLIPVITGSEVRDWRVNSHLDGVILGESGRFARDLDGFPHQKRRLWPYRTILELRRNYTGRSYLEDGRRWYSWHQISETPGAHPWSLVFPWVSTHNHFAVLKEQAAPLNSAPVIRLPDTASDSDVFQLTALLNSSLACFWLKHYSNSKGQPRAEQTGSGEPWTRFYEFTGSRLADFPLPPDRWSGDRWSTHAEAMDQLAGDLTRIAPRTLLAADSAISPLELDAARLKWKQAYRRLVGLQEELDWEIYGRYGLLEGDSELTVSRDEVPELSPGERAFEIVLARYLDSGKAETTWFDRHEITPISTLPHHWSNKYRQIVGNRIAAIRNMEHVGAVERPEFKRRWTIEPWSVQEAKAIREWLLDQCERRELWYEQRQGALRPRPLTARRLAEFIRKAGNAMALARRHWPESEFEAVLADIIEDELVPYTSPLRYRTNGMAKHGTWIETWNLQRLEDETGVRPDIPAPPKYVPADYLKASYWRLRRKFDVPNERFISYADPSGEGELLIGWAGWDPAERAAVLMDLINDKASADYDTSDVVVPLMVGLRELIFWLERESDAREARAYLVRMKEILDVSDSDLANWRPPKPKRGRPRKKPTY
jgi:hypothetical protein